MSRHLLKHLRGWKKLAAYRQRHILKELSTRRLAVVEYSVPVSPDSRINGEKLLFFADLHWDGTGTELIPVFNQAIAEIKPRWLVFGGDLVTYSCHFSSAVGFLQQLDTSERHCIAVYGNWDRRRKFWFPHRTCCELYARAGFKLLTNESVCLDGIKFWGVDDPRLGHPDLTGLFDPAIEKQHDFTCFVTHNTELTIEFDPDELLSQCQLILGGHSHAGQIRIPGFGAIMTSSRYWKLFEYGQYRHKQPQCDFIITSGIGTSRIPFRLFCEPEIVIINFFSETEQGSDK